MRARIATERPGGETRPIAVSLAWRRYLVAVRTAAPADYERIEERAWRRLASELVLLEAPLPDPALDADPV